jgi:SAM-dependent methyltransferase
MRHDHRHAPDHADNATIWEGIHRERPERPWDGGANPILIDVAASLPAGTALDLGCGEGSDALWLATRGWRVTAVDISATALARVAARAEAAGVGDRVEVQRHDLGSSFPAGAFDLVSAHYVCSPVALPRERFLRPAARAVAPGGLLLVVEHASVAPWSWDQDPATRFPTPQEVLDSLALEPGAWHAERLETPWRPAVGPDGETASVADNVVAVRRIAR